MYFYYSIDWIVLKKIDNLSPQQDYKPFQNSIILIIDAQ